MVGGAMAASSGAPAAAVPFFSLRPSRAPLSSYLIILTVCCRILPLTMLVRVALIDFKSTQLSWIKQSCSQIMSVCCVETLAVT